TPGRASAKRSPNDKGSPHGSLFYAFYLTLDCYNPRNNEGRQSRPSCESSAVADGEWYKCHQYQRNTHHDQGHQDPFMALIEGAWLLIGQTHFLFAHHLSCQ